MNKQIIDASSRQNCEADAYQQAAYTPPNYKDLSSASNALDKVIGNFFKTCMEKYDAEWKKLHSHKIIYWLRQINANEKTCS